MDRNGETLNGERIFCPHVNVAVVSFGRNTGDNHALKDTVRIAFSSPKHAVCGVRVFRIG